jgi:hypothetical protein
MTHKFALYAVTTALLMCAGCADLGPGGGSVNPDGGANAYLNTFNPALRIQASPENGGRASTSPLPDSDGKFRYRETVAVKAVPNSGYAFKEWSGASTGSVDSLRIVMDSNKTLTAHFIPTYKLTVAVNPSGSGIVKRDPDKLYYASGESVTIEAIDSDKYAFDAWSDGVKSSVREIVISKNETLTAYFWLK